MRRGAKKGWPKGKPRKIAAGFAGFVQTFPFRLLLKTRGSLGRLRYLEVTYDAPDIDAAIKQAAIEYPEYVLDAYKVTGEPLFRMDRQQTL